MKTLAAMVLAAVLVFFGMIFSVEATECGRSPCTESDPTFSQIKDLHQRINRLVGRVDRVDARIGRVEANVKSLAGRVGQPTTAQLQTILYGKLPQGIKVSFTGIAEMSLKGVVDARKLMKAGGYTVKEVILVPPSEVDETTLEVITERRTAALAAEYGYGIVVRAPADKAETAELAAAGVGAGNALVHLVPKP